MPLAWVLDQHYSRAEAARSLGLNQNLLGRWVKEHESGDAQAFRGNGKLTPEQKELRDLRIRVKRLEMEKDILKKATVGSISTISREIKRNRGRRWYKALDADRRAWRFAKRPKPCALDINIGLRLLVTEKLKLNWSPEQISGWIKVNLPRQKAMHISHETIYKTLYIRTRDALNHKLAKHLRRSHKMRHSKHHSRSGDRGTINIVNGVSIHQRPKHIEKRKSIGHWEGDLVTGTGNTHIATLVDRMTRYTLILKLKGKDSESVNRALVNAFSRLPASMKKSLTWDRGMELAKHAEFTRLTNLPVYFCDPQSPWQRGTNENTNSLIRQYFPKKTCLAQHSQQKLDMVKTQLNERPRKVLKFRTPKEMMEKSVAMTG